FGRDLSSGPLSNHISASSPPSLSLLLCFSLDPSLPSLSPTYSSDLLFLLLYALHLSFIHLSHSLSLLSVLPPSISSLLPHSLSSIYWMFLLLPFSFPPSLS